MPTNTWQAYNCPTRTATAWATRGTPAANQRPPRPAVPRTRRSAASAATTCLPAVARWTGRTADVLTDNELEGFPNGDGLAAPYDLVVFPGHTEYVTQHSYDVVERYRDLGGNLMFLSANNFFWQVVQNGQWTSDQALAQPRPARGGAARRPVPGERQRHEAGRLQRPRHGRRAVALRGDRPRRRQHPRRDGGRLRDRDRLDDAVLAARDEGRWRRSRTSSGLG